MAYHPGVQHGVAVRGGRLEHRVGPIPKVRGRGLHHDVGDDPHAARQALQPPRGLLTAG